MRNTELKDVEVLSFNSSLEKSNNAREARLDANSAIRLFLQ